MSNSSLVSYTRLSPNNSGTRTEKICFFTPHCYVGHASVQDAAAWLCNPAAKASANYYISDAPAVALLVPESQRSWCSSSEWNDQRAVTVECASDKTHPYAMTTQVYMKLIELATDICRRNGKKKLLWFADKAKTMAYKPAADEMVITVHRWFANKECPGDWLYSRLGDVAMKVTAALQKDSASSETPSNSAQPSSGTQATAIHTLADEKAKAVAMLELVHRCDKSGIMNSVTTAQMILESGYCGTDLARMANNCFGMKQTLSNNDWGGSTWDGKSTYTKRTAEQKKDGTVYYVTAAFRKYPCIEDSIQDHAAYLIGAKKDANTKRYYGLTSAANYREAIHIIKAGGYATDVRYVDKICSIIERYHLDRYDSHPEVKEPEKTVTYIVQAGAFNSVQKAEERLVKVRKIVPDAYLKYEGGMQKIRAGVYSDPETGKADAENVKARLESAGIECIIKER